MKKIFAAFLAMSMLNFPVYIEAAEGMSVTAVTPNPLQNDSYGKFIGVNQGYLNLFFSYELDEETAENITFTDSDGNAPVGGIFKTVDGEKLTIEFGELKENTNYTLTVPKSVKSADGKNLDDNVTYTYKTLEKIAIEEDFEEFSDSFSYSVSDLTSFKKFDGTDLTVRALSKKGEIKAVSGVTSGGDRYVDFIQNNTEGSTFSLGVAPVGIYSKLFIEGNFLTKVKIAASQKAGNAVPDIRMGRFHEYNFADQYPSGGVSGLIMFSNIIKDFEATDDDFYEIQLASKKYNTLKGTSNFNADWKTTAKDLEGGNSVSAEGAYTNSGVAASVSNYSVAQIYNGTANSGNGFKIAYIKTGLFTEPKFLGTPEYDGESYTFTGTVNTDLDEKTFENIRIYDAEKEYNYEIDYSAAERKLSLTITDKVYDGFLYNISFNGVKSKDGFEMWGEDIAFTHKNENDVVISPKVEGYSYDGVENTLVLNMNTEIDEESINGIKLLDLRKNGNQMPYSADCDGNVITIKIDYDMYYDCEYKVDISGVKSKEGFLVKAENSSFTFVHDDEDDILNLLTVENISPDPKQIYTIKDGVTTFTEEAKFMSPNQGYIRIKFNKPVDSKTVEGIKFTDSNGNVPVGGVYYNVVDNAVEVKFGELKPETEYSLKITKSLKGEDNAFIDDEIEYKWTTLKKLSIEEDLSGFNVGDYEYIEGKDSYPVMFGDGGISISNRSGYKTHIDIKETVNGKKFARITQDVSGKKINIGWLPSGVVDKYGNTKPFFTEGKVSAIVELNQYVAGSSSDIVVSNIHNWNYADGYQATRITALKDFATVDGFYKLQMTSSKFNTAPTSVDSSGKMRFDCNYKNTVVDLYSGNALSQDYSISNHTNAGFIDSYSLINSYNSTGMEGNGFDIAYIKLGLFMNPEFLCEPVYNVENNTITYQVNTDINKETLKNACITNKITGNPVLAEFTYDESKRTITATLQETLEYQTNYITDFTKVESVDGFVFAEKNEFRNLLKIEDIVENIEVSNDFNSGYINIEFENEVAITKDDILLKNHEGEEIDFDVEVSGENAIITFVNEYDYVNDYKLTIKKSIKSIAHGELKFESDMEYSFKLDDILSVSAFRKNGSGYSAKILNNTEKDVEALVTVAIYDENGRVLNAIFNVYNISAGTSKNISATLSERTGAKKAKIFVLNNEPELDTMYKSLTYELN